MQRITVAGRVLNDKQVAGVACVYCRTTFGAMEPIDVGAQVPGLLFLFAHPECCGR